MTRLPYVKLMSDYEAGWPLWGGLSDVSAEALGLSPGLTARLVAWQRLFDDHFHWERGWTDGGAAIAYAKEGPQLNVLLTREIGDRFVVEFDDWPVAGS